MEPSTPYLSTPRSHMLDILDLHTIQASLTFSLSYGKATHSLSLSIFCDYVKFRHHIHTRHTSPPSLSCTGTIKIKNASLYHHQNHMCMYTLLHSQTYNKIIITCICNPSFTHLQFIPITCACIMWLYPNSITIYTHPQLESPNHDSA
jgi:hypothetical protein